MKRNWKILLAVGLILAAVAAERVTAYYAEDLAGKRKAAGRKLDEVVIRTSAVARERAQYEQALTVAEKLNSRVQWEPDSSNILRWFAETAVEVGTRATSTKMIALAKTNATSAVRRPEGSASVAGGAFTRMRYDVLVEGGYGSLARYVERVEHSPHAMLIEDLSLYTSRKERGRAELKMTVSCLCLVPKEPAAVAKVGETREPR